MDEQFYAPLYYSRSTDMTKLSDMFTTDKIRFDLEILLSMEALQADIIRY